MHPHHQEHHPCQCPSAHRTIAVHHNDVLDHHRLITLNDVHQERVEVLIWILWWDLYRVISQSTRDQYILSTHRRCVVRIRIGLEQEPDVRVRTTFWDRSPK